MRKALFTGTFDPFTAGHADIVRRALPLFDGIIIGVVGDNVHKPQMTPAAVRCEAIASLYAGEPRIEVKVFNGLAVSLARDEQAAGFIKGVRSLKDFEYERDMADINRRLSGIDTLLLFADPSLSAVSSSVVRELRHFGCDVSPFLPQQPAEGANE